MRSPAWFARLDAIIETARQMPETALGRKEIQALFGCSERDSIRLLHKFGAGVEADALSLSTDALSVQLEAVRAGAAYAAFLRQHRRLAHHLATAHAENAARGRPIRGGAEFRVGRTLGDLPAGVRLEPGRVVCEFESAEEFWEAIDTLADIAAQDPEAFERATQR